MNRNFIRIIFLQLLFINYADAQTYSKNLQLKFDFGYGNSLSGNIRSEQYLFFFKIPNMEGMFGRCSCDLDFNLEYIREENTETYVIGFVPMFRYDFSIFNQNLFFRGGIGANYINNDKIGPRKTGSKLIFSDMISFGARLYKGNNYSFEVSYLFRHISNAGLYIENDGLNSQYLIISIVM